MSEVQDRQKFRIPDEIANIIVSPASYTKEEVLYPAMKWLRANRPVGLAEVEGFDPIWIVSKHADIMEIERNPALFHNADLNPILNTKAADAFTRQINNGSIITVAALTHMDAPDHTRVRDITASWFLPANVRKLEDKIRVLAKEAVEHFLSFDGECDFLKDFALMYPLHVVMTLFGVPREDEPKMLKLTQEFFGVHDPDEQRADVEAGTPEAAAAAFFAALQDFYAYFSSLTRDARESPKDNLLSLIANTKFNGEFISDWEANGYYVTVATAGHDTTSSSTASGLLGMIRFPEQFAKVKADMSLVGGLVDEAIRYASPVKHFMRNTTQAMEFRGIQLDKMERLMLCYPSANRDETIFDEPDAFKIDRRPNRHLAFGYGPHMCLGQHLAKMEMRILFEELLPKLQSVELAGEPRYMETNFVGGLKSLPIRFKKV
jgi:cytochrome P450